MSAFKFHISILMFCLFGSDMIAFVSKSLSVINESQHTSGQIQAKKAQQLVSEGLIQEQPIGVKVIEYENDKKAEKICSTPEAASFQCLLLAFKQLSEVSHSFTSSVNEPVGSF
jgi:hypothetical protein